MATKIDVFFFSLIQILTWYFEPSVVLVIKISPELNADFECPLPKLEICQKVNRVLQLRHADVKFSTFVCLSYHVYFPLT